MSQLTPKQKKGLLFAVLLLLFAAGKFWLLHWFTQQQPEITAVAAPCQPAQGCTLPDGSRLQFRAALRQPFDIELSNVPAGVQQVAISFSMRDMDMGFNRFDLRPQTDNSGHWRATQVRLPVCTDQRHDYLADVHIGEQTFQVAFEAY